MTKYVSGGYVKFSTENKELFYKTVSVTKHEMGTLCGGKVTSKEMLSKILNAKKIQEVFWS